MGFYETMMAQQRIDKRRGMEGSMAANDTHLKAPTKDQPKKGKPWETVCGLPGEERVLAAEGELATCATCKGEPEPDADKMPPDDVPEPEVEEAGLLPADDAEVTKEVSAAALEEERFTAKANPSGQPEVDS